MMLRKVRKMKLLVLLAAVVCASGQSLTVSPSVYTTNGDLVTVEWSGISGATTSTVDTISLVQSVGNNSDAALLSLWPLRYKYADQASETWLQGSGKTQFFVFNHRKPLYVLYSRFPAKLPKTGSAWGSQTVLAKAMLTPSAALLAAPHQLRISLAPSSSYTSFNVQAAWQSTGTAGALAISTNAAALQRWRNSPQTTTFGVRVFPATSTTYAASDFCGAPANSSGWLEPGYSLSAVATNLAPNTQYYYAVGVKSTGLLSATKSFTTPPVTRGHCLQAAGASGGGYGAGGGGYGVPKGRDYDDDKGYGRKLLQNVSMAAAEDIAVVAGATVEAASKPRGKPPGRSCRGKNKAMCSTSLGDCLDNYVAPLRLLLAADMGTHNNGDQSNLVDGQGFSALETAQTDLGLVVPPGLTEFGFPAGSLFYGLLTVADYPAGGQQPATRYTQASWNQKAATGQYHGAVLVGDIAYAMGISAKWDIFTSQLEDTTSTTLTMFSQGNHESEGSGLPQAFIQANPYGVPDAGGECGIAYERRLLMPFADGVPRSLRPEYYAVTMGPVGIVSLGTDQLFAAGSVQYTWLQRTLRRLSFERRTGRLPWLVLAFHRPMYVDDPDTTPGDGNQWVASELQKNIEPLLAQYQVDAVWTGHAHIYHRSCPVYKNLCYTAPPAGAPSNWVTPVHLLFGNAGFQPGASVFNTTPPWIAKESFAYGTCTLEATETTMTTTCYDDYLKTTIDTFTLTKPRNWRPVPPATAAAIFQGLQPLPTDQLPIGINVAGGIGELAALLLKGNATQLQQLLELVLFQNFNEIVAEFNASSKIGKLLQSPPGERLYSMADIQPVYYRILQIVKATLAVIPPPGGVFAPELQPFEPLLRGFQNSTLPGVDVVNYLLSINSPATANSPQGRLYCLVTSGTGC